MNYYKRHLGDYAKDTKHLSLAEHGAFTVLLDYYYATEKPIPDDRCERIANAYADFERVAVRAVLSEFFKLTDSGWVNRRADLVIAESAAKSLKAKESADARWGKDESERNANASKTHVERNASHKPLAISQKEALVEPNGSTSSSPSADDPAGDPEARALADAKAAKREQAAQRLCEITDDASDAYNAICAKPNGLLPKATKPGRQTRQANVRRVLMVASAICDEQYGDKRITRQFWDDYFGAVQADEHKSGRLGGGKGHETWVPDFEYLTKRDTMVDLFEKTVSEIQS